MSCKQFEKARVKTSDAQSAAKLVESTPGTRAGASWILTCMHIAAQDGADDGSWAAARGRTRAEMANRYMLLERVVSRERSGAEGRALRKGIYLRTHIFGVDRNG